jgi:hypothetical protein
MVPVLIPVSEFVPMTTLWGPEPDTLFPALTDALQVPELVPLTIAVVPPVVALTPCLKLKACGV